MEVSSSTTAPAETGKDPMKKALEVQEQSVMKVLEGLEVQSQQIKEMNAQKTGLGKSLDLLS
ncbi:MAG: hypothetical protein B6229_01770 [Spirochaetaceae bacterium 4572_7]|nr:MAG: hypothetical protein B6229_01770 [Spirochaetaceae bacterium 4572_7]